MEIKKTWGGARKGAGKKPSGKVYVSLYITAEDFERLKKLSADKGLSYGCILSSFLAGKPL